LLYARSVEVCLQNNERWALPEIQGYDALTKNAGRVADGGGVAF
jgi:hypothetical protein